MIVECTNCATRFQLDDARVPLRGIRVRCSRCKEAFFLEHPDASRSDALNDVAQQATRGSLPDATRDLPPGASVRDEGPSSEFEEEDWEFNADLPDEDPNEASGHDFGGDERSDFADADQQIGLGDDPDSVSGLDEVSVDDDDLASGLDLAGGPSEIGGASGDGAPAGPGSEVASDFGEVTDFSGQPGAGAAVAAPGAEEVAEPEDWDFFSDESEETPALASRDDTLDRIMLAVEDPSPLRARARGPELGASRSDRPARLQAGLASAGRALGWIVTCGLLGLGIARGVVDVSAAGARPITSVELGPFAARQVTGKWLETARSTHLYAVSGQLVNDDRVVRTPGRGLRVALMSPQGERLEVPAAAVGVPMDETRLRELPARELAMAAERAASELASFRVAPGRAVPFLALFDGIPDGATGFVIEADASPPPRAAGTADGVERAGTGGGTAGSELDEVPVGSLATAAGATTIPSSAAPGPSAPQPIAR